MRLVGPLGSSVRVSFPVPELLRPLVVQVPARAYRELVVMVPAAVGAVRAVAAPLYLSLVSYPCDTSLCGIADLVRADLALVCDECFTNCFISFRGYFSFSTAASAAAPGSP